MSVGLDIKKTVYFRIIRTKLIYGNGPFGESLRSNEEETKDWSLGLPVLLLEMTTDDQQLSTHLKGNLAGAKIYRHPTGQELTGNGTPARGQMTFGATTTNTQAGPWVSVLGFLTPEIFDAATSALLVGGKNLINTACLRVGFKEEADKIDFKLKEDDQIGNYLISDLSLSFQIGRD